MLGTKRKLWFLLFSTAALLGGVLLYQNISAHGTIVTPISRVYSCYLEGPENPKSDACKAMVAAGGTQALYDWNEVNLLAGDKHRELIPDGELCSAGRDKYKGLDLARNDWPTQMIAGDANGNYEFVYKASAPHSTKYFDFYVTKNGYDPAQPLKWSDLEPEPFCKITEVTLDNGHYRMSCPLPKNKSGKHVIYNIWQRDDSDESFYACSDVQFGNDPSATPIAGTPTVPATPVSTGTATAPVGGEMIYLPLILNNAESSAASAPGGQKPVTTPIATSGAPMPTPEASATPQTPVPHSGPRHVVGYYTAWSVYGRDFHVADIDASHLTHINYAFANVSNDGECILGDAYADTQKFYTATDDWNDPAGTLRGNFNQLLELKKKHPHLKTLISVGGWSWSTNFSDAAYTQESREKFARSCVAFMKKYGFDGVDIDWEYPVSGGLASNKNRPEDKHNYTHLLQDLRTELDKAEAADGKEYLLTIAAPAGPAIVANYELDAIHQSLDWINVMAYDYHGSWENKTDHNAPLYAGTHDVFSFTPAELSVSSTLNSYLAGGVPAHKLILGVPFYGRGWSGVPAANNGLSQSGPNAANGTWEAGIFDYKDLVQNYLSAGSGYTRYWDDTAKVPWLYNPATGIMISYDDVESMRYKVDFATDKNLAGVMFWELSSDTAGQDSLLGTIYDRLNP